MSYSSSVDSSRLCQSRSLLLGLDSGGVDMAYTSMTCPQRLIQFEF